jgi:hypothetical protein
VLQQQEKRREDLGTQQTSLSLSLKLEYDERKKKDMML